MINRDLEIEDVYMCKDPTIFQQKFIEIAQQNNFQLNQKNFTNFQEEFKMKNRVINELSQEQNQTLKLITNLISNPAIKKIVTRNKYKNWEKILDKINFEFQCNNINWWKHHNRIKGNNLKMIKNNQKMEKEYFAHVNSITNPVNQELLQQITDTKKLFKTKNNTQNQNKTDPNKPFFSVEEIKEQIQWIKNKSTKYFDKLKLYKQEQTQNQQNQNETYNQFIASIQTVFNNWIKNPNNSTINFIKERDLLFIHKKGDEGLTLNYRPISINSSLARIFLKLLYKKN
ncbi:RNA-directed DNA polymerase from transposon x-element-like protein-related [Anaeramoeba flamelloides]|uniref:RNA-directed DNA polymerase from transposon x-element-like protein-related n=1 Tax=Anaeramoeba flamelloides TaxID=1746091 RepID=A0AAV7ZWS6_9EUKA|nr:RNA-directed DNA polymerase from transposon x-element-like protein-related [Anaeramoeba flamelloides]